MTYIESFLKRKILRLPVQKDSGFQGQIETKPVLGFNCLRCGPHCSPRIPLCPPPPGPRGQRQHLRVGLGRRRQLRWLQLRRLRIEHVDHLHQLRHQWRQDRALRWELLLHAGLHLQQWAQAEPRGRRGEWGPGVREDFSDVIHRHGDVMEGGPSFKESAPVPRGDAPLF